MKNVINRTLKKGIVTVLLISSIPAYNLGNTVDYIKCIIFDECKKEKEKL